MGQHSNAPLPQVHLGWKALGDILNKIIDKVNDDTPLQGEGIYISDGGGKVISTVKPGSSGGGGTTEQTVVSGGGGTTVTADHDIKSVVLWKGVTWQTVTVVDSGCNRSQRTFLMQTGNDSDSVAINLGDNFWVDSSV